MGFKDAEWAYALKLPTTQKVVLAAVAFRTDDKTHQTFVGQETVARMLGMNRATVNRALGVLETSSIITRAKRHGTYGQRKTDTITCNVSYVTPANVGESNVGEAQVGLDVRPSDSHAEPVSRSSTAEEVTQEDHSVGHPVSPAVRTASFADFWLVWPRSEDKKRSEIAWDKAIKRADPDLIVARATEYSNHPHRPARQYVKYAASWLNGDCWNDPMPAAPEIDNRNAKPTPTDRALAVLALGSDHKEISA